MFASLIQTIIRSGISEQTVLVLLYLPIATTLIIFARYVIGWRGYALGTTTLLTFALYEISHTLEGEPEIFGGLLLGGAFVFMSICAGYFVQRLLRETRMHSLAKLTMAMTLSAILSLVFLYNFHPKIYFSSLKLGIMPIVFIALVVDLVIRNYVRKGFRKSLILLMYTFALCFSIFALFAQDWFMTFTLRHPELSVISLVAAYFIGHWKGLRLTEYFRFSDLLTQDDEPTSENR